MSNRNDISNKLVENARKVDIFIEDILRPKSPEVLYEASRHLILAGGKRIRPFLTIASCEAVGGDPENAIPYAAGLEILHNFTLIHDDVMDNDSIRRGASTVHLRYGIPIAICAGDLLFAKTYEAFSSKAPFKVSNKQIRSCIEIATRATIEICEGQVLDVSFPNLLNVTENDYFIMIGKKTSALFRACAEIGAVIGGGSRRQTNILGKFAFNSGISFQIVDDILGVTSDQKTLGKPVGSDLREGKKTMILIHALRHANSRQRRKLESIIGNKSASNDSFEEVSQILRDLGSISYASKKADRYIILAKKQLSKLPESASQQNLQDLVDYFTQRYF